MKRAESDTTAELKRAWAHYLRNNGHNTTQQRELIVDFFFRAPGHVSVDELLAKVRRKNDKIGYATVYRTLKLLVEAGFATARHFGEGHTRYELAGDHHDHLICTECGLILEFEDEAIEELQEAIAQRLGGFEVTRHRHELYGRCARARGVAGGRCPNDELRNKKT